MRLVTVLALKSFDAYTAGEVYAVPMGEAVACLIVDHYLRLLEDPAWRSSGDDGSDPSGDGVRPHP